MKELPYIHYFAEAGSGLVAVYAGEISSPAAFYAPCDENGNFLNDCQIEYRYYYGDGKYSNIKCPVNVNKIDDNTLSFIIDNRKITFLKSGDKVLKYIGDPELIVDSECNFIRVDFNCNVDDLLVLEDKMIVLIGYYPHFGF